MPNPSAEFEAFLQAYPTFFQTESLDALRRSEYTRLDDAEQQDLAREDFRFLRRLRLSWDGAVSKVGNAVLLGIIAVGGTIIGLGFWAWLSSNLHK